MASLTAKAQSKMYEMRMSTILHSPELYSFMKVAENLLYQGGDYHSRADIRNFITTLELLLNTYKEAPNGPVPEKTS